MLEFIVVFVVWAVGHSLTADGRVKTAVRARIGERAYTGLYRLGYNLFSLLSIVPVLLVLAWRVPDTVLWRMPAPYAWLAMVVQLLGFAGLLAALLQTDVWEFVGLRQAVNYWRGAAHLLPPPRLVTTGMYALVRHPLYFFSLLILWPAPVLTLQTLIFNLMATLYLWAGSRVEERRLTAVFGTEYEAYRQDVPGLLPMRGWKRVNH
ncbi:MAG: isoprenylcysteine carboxylmethyltransferase family protein [Anaerolineales bacterium]|nr:isoprenylcysteine carboxylmethyltransferase family protein [Anaerolineales bacterium]